MKGEIRDMGMINPEKYYKETMRRKPSAIIKKFFANGYNEKLQGNTALDLGCGAGNDTEFLISKGFKVTAVDCEENVRDILKSRNINSSDLNIVIDDFSKTELPKVDLVVANFSLFFINDNLQEFMRRILKDNINSEGFFVGNFLGKEDDWSKKRTTVNKEELLEYFKDYDIMYFSEEKYYRDGAISDRNKFWHIYTVIARRHN